MDMQESELHRKKLEWLSSFLWHWQNSGVLTAETAETLLHILQQEPGKTEPCQFPDARDLVRNLETS